MINFYYLLFGLSRNSYNQENYFTHHGSQCTVYVLQLFLLLFFRKKPSKSGKNNTKKNYWRKKNSTDKTSLQKIDSIDSVLSSVFAIANFFIWKGFFKKSSKWRRCLFFFHFGFLSLSIATIIKYQSKQIVLIMNINRHLWWIPLRTSKSTSAHVTTH